MVVPASADEYASRPVSWWDSYILKGISSPTNLPLWDTICVNIADHLSGAVCAGSSPDNLHHGSVTKEGTRGGVDKNGKPFFDCICQYCGDHFKGYASDLSAAYDAYVSDLPASGYTSAGRLIWQPSLADMVSDSSDSSYVSYSFISNSSRRVSVSDLPFSVEDNSCSLSISGNATSNGYDFYWSNILYHRCGQVIYFSVPFSGSYRILESPLFSCHGLLTSGEVASNSKNYGVGSFVHYLSGDSIKIDVGLSFGSGSYSTLYVLSYFPVYEIIPDTAISGDVYNINTRPTSITGGNYGIVGDNGQIVKVEDNSTIVNETNNTYYNPATGTTSPIIDWSYDYSDRSYTVTTESGDTVTITYGDENITIKEGDTIYNVYYLVDGSGSENPPEACVHEWAETSRTEPTCTRPGSVVSTCSKCQQTKTEPIPALGHDWQVKQTVTTEYDDTGQLVQEGYTIFECSRCQEQYKSTDGTAPPDKPPDSGEEDGEKKCFFAWLWDVLTDSLKKLIESIIDTILKTIDFFFGGDGQSNADFYNNPSTFSGVSVWD